MKIVYYKPPKGIFSNPEYNFSKQLTDFYNNKAKSQQDIKDLISLHIEQDISGQKFSPQQIQCFLKVTFFKLNTLLYQKDFTSVYNMLVPLLDCENKYLSDTTKAYCEQKKIKLVYSNDQDEQNMDSSKVDSDSGSSTIEMTSEEIKEMYGSSSEESEMMGDTSQSLDCS